MSLPVAPGREGSTTHITGVGLFACVCAHVQLEVLGPLARLAAGWAGVQSLAGLLIAARWPVGEHRQWGLPPIVVGWHLQHGG